MNKEIDNESDEIFDETAVSNVATQETASVIHPPAGSPEFFLPWRPAKDGEFPSCIRRSYTRHAHLREQRKAVERLPHSPEKVAKIRAIDKQIADLGKHIGKIQNGLPTLETNYLEVLAARHARKLNHPGERAARAKYLTESFAAGKFSDEAPLIFASNANPLIRRLFEDSEDLTQTAKTIRAALAKYELLWLAAWPKVHQESRREELCHQMSGITDAEKLESLHSELLMIDGSSSRTIRANWTRQLDEAFAPLGKLLGVLTRLALTFAKLERVILVEDETARFNAEGMEFEETAISRQFDPLIKELSALVAPHTSTFNSPWPQDPSTTVFTTFFKIEL